MKPQQAESEGMAAGKRRGGRTPIWDLGDALPLEIQEARQEYLRRAQKRGRGYSLQLAMDEYAWALEGLMG